MAGLLLLLIAASFQRSAHGDEAEQGSYVIGSTDRALTRAAGICALALTRRFNR